MLTNSDDKMPTRIALAKQVLALLDSGAADDAIDAVLGNCDREMFEAVSALVGAEMRERIEQGTQQIEQDAAIAKIFEGHPLEITLQEAAEIEAAAGNDIALALLEQFGSRKQRVFDALFEAAVDAHPDWRRDSPGHYSNLTGAPLEDNAGTELVEWFQTNHPKQARAIEAAIKDV